MKAAAAASAVPVVQTETVEEAVHEAPRPVESDPTVAHAGLTEIDAGADTPMAETVVLTNGHDAPVEPPTPTDAPVNASTGDEAANAAGESQWDTGNGTKDLSMSQEWVEVPRDPAETETGLHATPAEVGNTQSWADEQPDHPPPTLPTAPSNASTGITANTASVEANDGFHQVQRHNRGRSEHNGFRGGRGGGYRGRGRGDGRGRGRGRGGGPGHNNGNGGNGGFFRSPRRNEES